jgi:hypothetical protein
VSIVSAVGITLGTVPFLLHLNYRLALVAGAIFVFTSISAAWNARKVTSQATEHPAQLEWVIAGCYAVATGAIAGFYGFMFSGIAYGLGWLADIAVLAFGKTLWVSPASVAWTVGLGIFTIFIALFSWTFVPDLSRKLYARTAGMRSYFSHLEKSRLFRDVAGIFFWGSVVLVLFIVQTDFSVHDLWFNVILTFLLVSFRSYIDDIGKRTQSSAPTVENLTALKNLFQAAGYQLTDRPRIDSAELDPLLQSIDLLALAGDHGYAITAKVLSSAESNVEWFVPSKVRTGAKALQQALKSDENSTIAMQPYLLVIGGQISEKFMKLCADEEVKVVHIPDPTSLPSTVASDSSADLRATALRLLEIAPGDTLFHTTTPSVSMTG